MKKTIASTVVFAFAIAPMVVRGTVYQHVYNDNNGSHGSLTNAFCWTSNGSEGGTHSGADGENLNPFQTTSISD